MSKTTTKPAAKPSAEPAPVRAPAPASPVGRLNGSLPLWKIRPCPFNVRRAFSDDDIRGLAESIASIGLKEPLLVRPVDAAGAVVDVRAGGWSDRVAHYELADGERRFRALTLLDETHAVDAVPVAVQTLTDDQVRAIMLASREQSRELSVSELVAGYAGLRARVADDAAVAAMVGKPVGHVRSVLRLAKLPAWALAAIDNGRLSRATAELAARVPGEESRAKCAAYVLAGIAYPPHEPDPVKLVASGDHVLCDDPLSYRDAKELIRDFFTKELKGAPFDRKALYVLGDFAPPACEPCPRRAANDPEAQAEGTRGDVCLDPDCYGKKVEAHDQEQLTKGAKKGWLTPPEDFAWPHYMESPPKGWCDIEAPAQLGDLSNDFAGSKKGATKLRELLGLGKKAAGDGLPVFAAVDPKHKLRGLVRTGDARRALQANGTLKKPEKVKREKREPGTVEPTAKAEAKRHSVWEVDQAAAEIAAKVLREYTQEQCSALDGHEDAHEEGPIRGALELVCRAVCYEFSRSREGEKLLREWVVPDGDFDKGLDAAIAGMTPSQVIGLLVAVAAWWETSDGPNRPTGESLLAFAELDWPALQEQARRELSGEEPADAKVQKAEAAEQVKEGKYFKGDPLSKFGLTEKDLDGSRCVEKWVNRDKVKAPVAVKPLILEGGLYIWTGAFHRLGGSEWTFRRLLTPAEFKSQYPDVKLRLAPGTISANAGYGDDLHAGVRVTVRGEERIIAGKNQNRLLMHPMTMRKTEDGKVVMLADGAPYDPEKHGPGKQPAPAAEQPTSPQQGEVKAAVETLLTLVPGFPTEAASHLADHGVVTVEDLDAKVKEIASQRGRGNATRYDAMEDLGVPLALKYKAGDALVDWSNPDAEQPKPAKKSSKKGAKSK
jgi:ParB/RepB/Spo0J family partition protein